MNAVPTIKNQYDRFVYEEAITSEVMFMINNGRDESYVNGRKISITKRYKDEDKCIVHLEIEGI